MFGSLWLGYFETTAVGIVDRERIAVGYALKKKKNTCEK